MAFIDRQIGTYILSVLGTKDAGSGTQRTMSGGETRSQFPEAKRESVAAMAMRDTLVQEIGLELIGSIVGAGVGGFAGFYLLWPIITPLNLGYGVDVCAYGAMFLGAPAGSLVAISFVEKMIRRFHQCTCRAIISALVACDLAIVLAKLLVGDSGIASGPGHLALIAGVSAFLGYKASGLGTTRPKSVDTGGAGGHILN